MEVCQPPEHQYQVRLMESTEGWSKAEYGYSNVGEGEAAGQQVEEPGSKGMGGTGI